MSGVPEEHDVRGEVQTLSVSWSAFCLIFKAYVKSTAVGVNGVGLGECSKSHNAELCSTFHALPNLLCRLKCHNKCTKEAPSCRISFLPSKLHFNPGYITDGHMDCVLHILCDISYMSSSRQNSEDWICPVWHKQPCWSAPRGTTIWYTPQSHYEKGKTNQHKDALHYSYITYTITSHDTFILIM